MNQGSGNFKLIYQIILLIMLILILPLSAIGYYFYSSTIRSMEQIGKERGITSVHTAQSLVNNLGENLLSITVSNSYWEDYRKAIQDGNISWIKQNVNENLASVSSLDFIITIDNSGNILSSAEEEGQLTKDLNYPAILSRLKKENEYSGLIETSKGLAIISVSRVTNEAGLAPPTGTLIFGRLLNQETFNYIKDTLQVNLGILTNHKQVFTSADSIKPDLLQTYLNRVHGSAITYETSTENNTIIVRTYKAILDINNQPVGVIYLEFPLTTSTDVVKSLKQMAILDEIIIIFLLVILTFVLQRRILLPLKHLKTALEQVVSGSSINEIPSKVIAHADRDILLLFEQLHRLAYYDYLTELPNRRFSSIYLEQTLKKAKIKGHKVAIMYFDLDRFKNINDSLGHNTGDQFLKVVANRLIKVVSSNGMVARLGGDEFVIILPEVIDLKEIETMANNIKAIFLEQFLVDNYDLFVTASVGISLYPDDGDSTDVLFMNADVAMYRAKEQGRNKFQFYSANMNSSLINKLKIESMLRNAIEKNELFLTYQPKINTQTNEIIGMEALIRWQNPELGLISPHDFIPIAEETGLIISIGEWVLKTACRQNKLWQEQGIPYLRVAVNISARQFQHDDIINTVSKVLNETGLDPKWLELEITESTIMQFASETVKTLTELKEKGISVSIDDFGTGYSSLSYLKLFPINSLKIDQSFIKDIEKDQGNLAIAKSVITLAHALNFEVVAEGVENQQHIEILRNESCDILQGFFYSPPLTVEAFEKWVEDKN